jgi:hypothetical protein
MRRFIIRAMMRILRLRWPGDIFTDAELCDWAVSEHHADEVFDMDEYCRRCER